MTMTATQVATSTRNTRGPMAAQVLARSSSSPGGRTDRSGSGGCGPVDGAGRGHAVTDVKRGLTMPSTPCTRHARHVWMAYCPECTAWHLARQMAHRHPPAVRRPTADAVSVPARQGASPPALSMRGLVA